MVLVDWEIEHAISENHIRITPFDKSLIQPNSLDIRLGHSFAWYEDCSNLIDTYEPRTLAERTKHCSDDYIDLKPGQFILAETLETVTLPDDIVATIEGKSSLARLGISLHQTGGWIDAGFSGTITLELSNANCRTIRLHSKMSIGQLVFHRTQKCRTPYGSGKLGSHYQNQMGATLSRYAESHVSQEENALDFCGGEL